MQLSAGLRDPSRVSLPASLHAEAPAGGQASTGKERNGRHSVPGGSVRATSQVNPANTQNYPGRTASLRRQMCLQITHFLTGEFRSEPESDSPPAHRMIPKGWSAALSKVVSGAFREKKKKN